MKAAKNPRIIAAPSPLIDIPMSFTWSRNAPKIAGIDNMKLNFAANSLSRPITKPAAIVVPERDNPGMIAQA